MVQNSSESLGYKVCGSRLLINSTLQTTHHIVVVEIMIRPDSARQASAGDENLLDPPDHNIHDSGRDSAHWNDAASETVVHFDQRPTLENTREESFTRTRPTLQSTREESFTRRPISPCRYTMSQIENMDFPNTETHSIGVAAAFRSAAMARKWSNNSRRQLLLKSRESSTREMTSELTPLQDATNGGSVTSENNQAADGKQIPQYNTVEALKSIIIRKPVSVFLLLVPFAILSAKAGWGANYIFWLNFFVMIPLAAILGDFTEEAALHTNATIGGLLNATFGNAVEVVVAIQALLANEIRVVQASMIGSIFSNLLLVLGCCFFFGGLKYKEQTFNSTVATANMGLLALSSIAMVLPTPFAEYYNVQDEHVLIISRIAALFLLFMYIQLLIFQLHTHRDIFDEDELTQQKSHDSERDADVVEEEEEPSISLKVALIGLGLTTLSVTLFSDYLVGSIDAFCESSGISRTFVGIIIIPIVGNAVEHITAVTVAMKNKMDLSMGGTLNFLIMIRPHDWKICFLICKQLLLL